MMRLLHADRSRLWSCGVVWLLIVVSMMLESCGHVTVTVNPTTSSGSVSGDVPTAQQEQAVLHQTTSPQRTNTRRLPHDTGWLPVRNGVTVRHIEFEQRQQWVPVHIVRAEPAAVTMQVAYAPNDNPYILARYCRADATIIAAINGGFFDATYLPVALVVSNGIAYGTSYQGQGGMVALDSNGTLSVRSLSHVPYTPNEPLVAAIQSWPMLLFAGGIIAYHNEQDSDRARRSVVAMDVHGNLLLLAFPTSSLTLTELSAWLAASDLQLDVALNLDGGSSTGLCSVGNAVGITVIDAFSPLPVLLVLRQP